MVINYMKINTMLKITFDAIMLILLIMLYSYSATGTIFHEIVGLIIYLFFIIHLVYNKKWIIGIYKSIRNKTLNQRTKFMYVINIILLILFILSGISGIMISKYIFKIGIVFIWRYIHILSSAFSVILLGIHLGLHIKMINNTIINKLKINYKIYKYICSILFVLIIGIGIYGIISSIGSVTEKDQKPEIRTIYHHFLEITNYNELKHSKEEIKKEDNENIKNKHNEIDKKDTFKIYSVITTSFGYLMIILIISVITYYVEHKIIKRKSTEKAHFA